jgi:NADH-quinone oxidoreductase subunit L
MLLAGTVRNLARPHGRSGGWASAVYWLLGGAHPVKAGGYAALAAMLLAAACAITGLVQYLDDAHNPSLSPARLEARWAERVEWVHVGAAKVEQPASALYLGYRIDRLTALMVTMVTVVGSLIFLFSLGYMRDEARDRVEDHEIHPPDRAHHLPARHEVTPAHPGDVFTRRGRFGRFFLYLSLFAFSMLNLLIADNLMQVFIGWELVGVCSFFLIGFYYERPAACAAANKAFVMNRIGDAGFLVGIAIAWATLGTLNFTEIFAQLDAGRPPALTNSLWTLMGLGLFLGCVGKSAQFPLQTWLPDAMEGPTPVSALIHAATMVAAGVYLVGRCYPLFSPDVFLVIAYIGCVTLFIAATTATVMTDIKRVLAYSTVSQLGYMMLALGVGGWTAGLFHLLTHACFKALLFLAAGSVIVGLHHEQDLRRMGGLRRKMPITAYTMLIGVLAISGTPFFSGWYSKDLLLSAALGFSLAHQEHFILFALPLITAGITAYYMFRLWLLAFTGEPRDRHAYDHAHESPWAMTLPLVVLALFSLAVGWGWPPWNAEASILAETLHAGAQPAHADFTAAHRLAEEYHLYAGGLALVAAIAGALTAYSLHRAKELIRAGTPGPVRQLLEHKWYFDELYAALFARPTLELAATAAAADKRPTSAEPEGDRRLDAGTLDGLLNAVGQLTGRLGESLRHLQTGMIRQYVLVLALTVVGLLGMLAVLAR